MTRDFRVKLISLPPNPIYPSFFLPYGLGILTAFLRDNNYNVVIDDLSIKIENHNRKPRFSLNSRIDLNILGYEKEIIDYLCHHSHNKKIEEFAGQITKLADFEGYDLIGISVITYFHFIFALLLSKNLKSMSNTKVVLGGPFITIYGNELFGQFPIGDYMIVGDGQIPLLSLIEHLEGRLPIEDVPNLLYRQDGSINVNPRKLFPVEDLYIPDFSDLPLDFYGRNMDDIGPLPYQISRGCTHRCSFCNRRAVNSCVEFKSYNKIVKELETMKRLYQSNYFWFYDDDISCSYEYLNMLCDIFIENKLSISWRTTARADNLDSKILHKMRKAGCKLLTFGIESGSNRILKMIGKGITVEQASKVLKDSYDEGIRNGVNLMVGFPHEQKEDIIETVEFVRKNSEYIDHIVAVTILALEHGSLLYSNSEKFGIENLRPILDVSKFKYFAFDEIGGLKWEEKIKQQEYFRKDVLKADFKYILSKKYRLGLIPFWFYFWAKERPELLNGGRFFQLRARLFPRLLRKST